jgi:hypothetical protein
MTLCLSRLISFWSMYPSSSGMPSTIIQTNATSDPVRARWYCLLVGPSTDGIAPATHPRLGADQCAAILSIGQRPQSRPPCAMQGP